MLPPSMMALATVGLVHDLTNNTFRSFLAENNMVLIGFVLPFLPTYQRFSQEFEEVYTSWLCTATLERLIVELYTGSPSGV